jgi:hypothetical protein
MIKNILERHKKFIVKRIFVNRKSDRRLKAIFIILVSTLIVAFPSVSYAYVDPGITGLFFQAVFAFLFGVVFVWVTKPFKYFANLIKQIRSLFRSTKNND